LLLALRREGPLAMAVAVATSWGAVAACWPEGVVSFFHTLHGLLNLGESHLHPRYVGHVAGATSPMLAVGFATSAAHLREVAYQLAWGGGWWSLPLLAGSTLAVLSGADAGRRVALRDARVWLGLLLVAWQVYYLLFMVPRLGVVEDIDLFFSTYLVLAFLAGRVLDATVAREPRVVAAVLGLSRASLALTAPMLVSGRLPSVP
jgi:hypothetical protein